MPFRATSNPLTTPNAAYFWSVKFCTLLSPSEKYKFVLFQGTGKTTVARLIAEILKDAGIRSKGTFVETSAQALKDNGPEKFRELIQSAMDGVLFIDEAYDLDPKGDFKGKPIVTELLVINHATCFK
jgi:hypothetical protein